MIWLIKDAVQTVMEVPKIPELVTIEPPIDEIDDTCSKEQQVPLASIEITPVSPSSINSLVNDANEKDKKLENSVEADAATPNYASLEVPTPQIIETESKIPVSITMFCLLKYKSRFYKGVPLPLI